MTLQQATLPTPRFDQITLDNLKQDIQQAIQAGQEFLNTLTAAPSETDQQLAVLEQIDALENNLSESWAVLSHLNAVMNNAETREVYQSLLPALSEYYTQLGQHTALYQTYQLIHAVLLRSMMQAYYGAKNAGHYGLAYEAYTHFTSPIRRYPDLLLHRAIKAHLKQKPYPLSGAALDDAGEHFSSPSKATPESLKSRKARRMALCCAGLSVE